MRRFFVAVAIALPALSCARDASRTDEVRQLTDSLRAESCRGGKLSADGLTCTGAQEAPRPDIIRGLANRLDAVAHDSDAGTVASCLPPSCNPGSPGNIGYALALYYNSSTFGFPVAGRDTVTLCVVVESTTGQRKLAWPPVRIRTIGDSATYEPRTSSRLSSTCALAIDRAGLTSTDSMVVHWNGEWVTLGTQRVWRPFAAVP